MLQKQSKFHAFALLASAWVLLCAPAQAEKADRNAALNWEADSARHDDLRQVTTLKGAVVITKGSIVMRAAQIEIKVDKEGYQQAKAQADGGKRVFFRQKREGLDEYIEAESETMDYDERADSVLFTGKAVLKRYRGAKLTDEASGHRVLYDNKTESFSLEQAAGTPGVPTGRVRGVLTPKSATESASASAPTPNLRPSGTLPGAPR
jgi:lipopolysaccharide export system protein LptA